MRVRERDLRHDADPVRFGSAMLKCDWGSADCCYAGRCLKGGECFSSPPHLVAARIIESMIPQAGREGLHTAYLRKCAELLRADRVLL